MMIDEGPHLLLAGELLLAALLGLLLLIALIHRLWRQASSRRRAAVAALDEESIAAFAAGEIARDRLIAQLKGRLRPQHEALLLGYAAQVAGERSADFSALFAALGLVERQYKRLRSPFWWRRAGGARALGQMGDGAAVPLLVGRLADPNPAVGFAAARALIDLGRADLLASRLAEQALQFGPLHLADLVAGTGDELTEGLLQLVAHPSPSVRQTACELLGQLRSTAAVPLLGDRLRHDTLPVQSAAARAAGAIGAPELVDPLTAALGGAPSLQRAAAEALGRIGDPSAIPALAALLQSDQRTVVDAGARALLALGADGRRAIEEAVAAPLAKVAAALLPVGEGSR